MRIAGAPISWGACEVPGWGYQMAPERVLTEMRRAGLTATELGPDGFLPSDTAALVSLLDGYGLSCVGGFVPVVLFDPDHDPMDELAGPLESLVAAGAGVVVLAAATGSDGYDARPELTEKQWQTLLSNLDRLSAVVAERGLVAVLHPHVGTMVENRAEVDRVLAGSDIGLCLDTGHLLIGGTDPLELARQVPERVKHAHLKDVDAKLAAKVQSGEITYTQGVAAGMYVPLGAGDVDIAAIVKSLEDNGFDGWYVMEQDNILNAEPTGDAQDGPLADVLASVAFLRQAAGVSV
ncbi:sugar phosphate isomerase/epimerase [Mycobacterium sp. Y57]|uniref:sugar phosphate isomerase/epimerase family protein n=1 Tax=Mycolicibacterium xanthum TaxID=2796469 RepID=UPI001C865B25|nr:sugar phosphate isomerase/epimerase [Mycolicibacterium xanthum]MBX7431423.1 sugar phosphate isomerase/epimerase [Mycolicibacterium xanthum]